MTGLLSYSHTNLKVTCKKLLEDNFALGIRLKSLRVKFMKNNLNLDYLATDLDESEMESVAGGTNTVFFDRWAEKINNGNVNIQGITQHFLSDFNSNSSRKSQSANCNHSSL